ncbi:MAG: substrate-binding domain-containing protein [Butyrivibrio sp.]|nr:substrate-binding domain-containing protein [Butyrivibrio sp.]
MNLGKRAFIFLILTSVSVCTACGKNADTNENSNKEKPVVWFNRQPSNSTTGELDLDAVNFNSKTYFVGLDMAQGTGLQGEMIINYLDNCDESLDRNGDGIIGYILAIGDAGHNISMSRTRGTRTALGTGVESNGEIDVTEAGINLDGTSAVVKDGTVNIAGKDFVIREIASKEMKSPEGITWDAETAGTYMKEWSGQFGDKIDLIVSNNDGMGLKMFEEWAHSNNVPVFGYDAIETCVAAIEDGFCGSISQRADVQAYLTLRVLRNGIDGVDVNTGISTQDEVGNVLTELDYYYSEKERAFKTLNLPVTKGNFNDYLDPKSTYPAVSHKLDATTHPKKRVWMNIYSVDDDFLNQTYRPLIQKYAEILNLDVTIVEGNGYDESSITDKLGAPSNYDAFAINMIKTDDAPIYMDILSK